jgi:hypothetical protein
VVVLPSALRPGLDEADIELSGNLLEVVVMDRPQGRAAIHANAMALRIKYRRLLPPGQ